MSAARRKALPERSEPYGRRGKPLGIDVLERAVYLPEKLGVPVAKAAKLMDMSTAALYEARRRLRETGSVAHAPRRAGPDVSYSDTILLDVARLVEAKPDLTAEQLVPILFTRHGSKMSARTVSRVFELMKRMTGPANFS
ncbi:hypothetical protein T492DRAFT_975166 [Pavlovales sp. CCMP2436]|nr:hypothetical protein T492DRAFT_975166 [Pavlovales sp. CCMP2436]